MGMYDSVICHAKLPGTPPAYVTKDHDFQTKDLDCLMDTYTITEDGYLDRRQRICLGNDKVFQSDDRIHFTGEINFYTTNLRGGGYGFQFTENGEDVESVDYLAKFVDGRLVGEIQETSRDLEPALPIKEMEDDEPRPDRQLDDDTSSLLGRIMWMSRWPIGGLWDDEEDIQVKIAAETDKWWCLEFEDGTLEVKQRIWERDKLFDSKEELQNFRNEQKEWRKRKEDRLQKLMEERMKKEVT